MGELPAWTPSFARNPATPPPEKEPAPEPVKEPESKDIPAVSAEGLTDDQIALLGELGTEEPIQVDDLIQSTGIPARRVLSALTMLEIDSFVVQHSGKRYTRSVSLRQ